jgi:hypothetical protein
MLYMTILNLTYISLILVKILTYFHSISRIFSPNLQYCSDDFVTGMVL